MGETQKQHEGSQKPVGTSKPGTPLVLPETHEVNIKARIPKAPNMTGDGLTEFPSAAILVYSNGTRIVLPIRQPKPSSASGKINAWGGGKIALEDNTQVQVGINLTVLD